MHAPFRICSTVFVGKGTDQDDHSCLKRHNASAHSILFRGLIASRIVTKVGGEHYRAMAPHRVCSNLSCMRHETREASKVVKHSFECTFGTVCHYPNLGDTNLVGSIHC